MNNCVKKSGQDLGPKIPKGLGDYPVPFLLGFSFGNLWICALLVFSLQATNRSTCGGYLVGRALVIVLLSILLASLGHTVKIDRILLNL